MAADTLDLTSTETTEQLTVVFPDGSHHRLIPPGELPLGIIRQMVSHPPEDVDGLIDLLTVVLPDTPRDDMADLNGAACSRILDFFMQQSQPESRTGSSGSRSSRSKGSAGRSKVG